MNYPIDRQTTMFDILNIDVLLLILINSDRLTVARLIAASKEFYECYKVNKEYIQSVICDEVTDQYGIKTTRKSGLLHSFKGQPAIVFPNGNKAWFNMGEVTEILYHDEFVEISQDKLMDRDEMEQQGYVFGEENGNTIITYDGDVYVVRNDCSITRGDDSFKFKDLKNGTVLVISNCAYETVYNINIRAVVHHEMSLDFAINRAVRMYDKFYSVPSETMSVKIWKIHGYDMYRV